MQISLYIYTRYIYIDVQEKRVAKVNVCIQENTFLIVEYIYIYIIFLMLKKENVEAMICY